MKIRNILALVALSFMLIITSCGKKDKGGIPDHLKIIPGNSMAVMTINAKELVEKGGLNKYKDFELYKKFHQEIAKNEPEATKLVDEFLKDTRSTGFDLDQIFMYVQQISEYDNLTIFTLGVDNADKVEKWLTRVYELQNPYDDEEVEIVKGNGYTYFRFDYSTLFVWDNTKALVLNIRESQEKQIPSFENLLSIDEEYSIVANADFMESYNTQKDFTFWFSIKRITEMNDTEEFDELIKIWGEEWKNASMDFSLNFTNDKAAFSASVWPVALAEKFQKEYPILKSDFDESLLRYFPENYFAVMKASFNVQEYYKIVIEKLNALTKELEEQDDDDDDYYYNYSPFGDYDYLMKLIAMIDNPDVAKIVGLFKGDVVADIFGFQEGMIPIPQFGVAVTINGEEAFNYLLGLLPEEITPTKVDTYYSYTIPQVMTIYAGQKGDIMYVTNTKEAIDNFYAQGYKDNLGSSSVVSYLKDSPLVYSVNLDISSYPAIATTMLRQSMGSMEYSILASLMEPFSSLNLVQTGKNSGELNLLLKENKENSLKVILKEIDSYASRLMGF